MKNFIILVSLVLSGCGTTYTATQVGPDRYVLSAKGKDAGPDDYPVLLESAFVACKSAGSFQDYTVQTIAYGKESMTLHVHCEKNKQDNPNANNPNAAVEDLKKLYEAAKRAVEEKLGDGK